MLFEIFAESAHGYYVAAVVEVAYEAQWDLLFVVFAYLCHVALERVEYVGRLTG